MTRLADEWSFTDARSWDEHNKRVAELSPEDRRRYHERFGPKIKHVTYLFIVRDVFGNTETVAVDECCDSVQICRVKTKDGEPFYFESDAYHLASCCAEHGIECHEEEVTISVPDPFTKF